MNRKEIRDYILILADEFDVDEDEGLFDAENLNVLINVSQNKVNMDMARLIPEKFRKTKLLDITTNKKTYSIVSDLEITDFLRFQKILHNVSGKRATPLLEIDPEDEWEYEDMEELTYWFREDKDNVCFGKTATSTAAERLKAYYISELAGLTEDSESPSMPAVCHPLISIDVLKQFVLADEGKWKEIEIYYQQVLLDTVRGLDVKSDFAYSGQKSSIRRILTSRDA